MNKTTCIYRLLKKCFVLSFLYLLFTNLQASAAELQVGDNKQFMSIKQAIQAAKPGDEIKIFPGTYTEGDLVIDKPLTLTGVNWPVLDGQKKYEILTIKANHVKVSGIFFKNSGFGNIKDIAAVRLQGAFYCTVTNNKLENNYFGIYLASSRKCTISYNHITGTYKSESASGNGIHNWKCDSLTITHNFVQGHRDGIYFEFVKHSHISHNYSTKNIRYGLHFMFSDGNVYESNRFYRNGAGVAVMYTQNIVMENNIFDENWGSASYGLLLKNIARSKITGNNFTQNTVGIFAEESDQLIISGNTFNNNGWAIKITSSCIEDTIVNNNFFTNTFDVATSGQSNSNYFTQNYWDKYRGYDMDKNSIGDVPYRPVSLFSMIMEKMPNAVMMLHSTVADILDQVERVYPQVIPESLNDQSPRMKPLVLASGKLHKTEKTAHKKSSGRSIFAGMLICVAAVIIFPRIKRFKKHA